MKTRAALLGRRGRGRGLYFVGTDDGEPSGASGTSRILSFRKDETSQNPVPKACKLEARRPEKLARVFRTDRTDLFYDEGRISLLGEGGRHDRYAHGAQDVPSLSMGSTSTPVYYKGYVYVGTGTGPGPSGGFAIVKENAQTGDLTLQRELTMPGSTQGSPLLSTAREAEGISISMNAQTISRAGLSASA